MKNFLLTWGLVILNLAFAVFSFYSGNIFGLINLGLAMWCWPSGVWPKKA